MNRATAALLFALLFPVTAFGKGPVGIGELKLGLTRDQVEHLAPSGGVELQGGLTAYEIPANVRDQVPPLPANKQMLQAMLITPWRPQSIETTFTFTDGALSLIELDLEDDYATMHTIKDQVTSKYGEPELVDSTRVEHCYTSAGTEDVKMGFSGWKWIQEQAGGVVETQLHSFVLDGCIGRKYGSKAHTTIYLSIGKKAAAANPF